MQLVAYDTACTNNGDANCLRPARLKVVCPCDDSARIEFVNPGFPVSDPLQVAIGDVVSTALRRASTNRADGTNTPN